MQNKLLTVPGQPGVYLFTDENKKVLYVGKAKDLRNRLRSYFQKSSSLDARKSSMMKLVRDFEYTVTGNELEAFVLESNLIKQYRPRYNVLLRDDKSYPYLKLTLNEKWPRLEVVRRARKDGARYFGPYVPSGPMWEILSFIRNNFLIRTCSYSLDKRMRPCIQHQIKRCSAPCAGIVDHDEYLRTVEEVRLLLEGKNRRLLEGLKNRMEKLSEQLRYEEAALVRDRIRAIEKVSERQKVISPELGDADVIGIFQGENTVVIKVLFIRSGAMIGSRHFSVRNVSGETSGYVMSNFMVQFYGKGIIPPPGIFCSTEPEDPELLSEWLFQKRGSRVGVAVPKRGLRRDLVKMAEENARVLALSDPGMEVPDAAREVAEFLGLNKVPEEIGAFDVSNISGHEPVGAFVCWASGNFTKKKYRHIRMDGVQGPDDYAMMRELVRRTIENLRDDLPGLLVIDGGKSHLEAAAAVLDESGVAGREIIGLAKDPDRVFFRGEKPPLVLQEGDAASLLLRRIRDEVHRFAVGYHKKLRSRRVFDSPLEKIEGIGKKRRFELLRHFGGLDAIRSSTVEEISKIKGFDIKIAARVLDSLRQDTKK